jgi:hypothetical protein
MNVYSHNTNEMHVGALSMKCVCVKILGLVFPMDGLSPELEESVSARKSLCRISTCVHMLQYIGITV